jgi:hypothetical protein
MGGWNGRAKRDPVDKIVVFEGALGVILNWNNVRLFLDRVLVSCSEERWTLAVNG